MARARSLTLNFPKFCHCIACKYVNSPKSIKCVMRWFFKTFLHLTLSANWSKLTCSAQSGRWRAIKNGPFSPKPDKRGKEPSVTSGRHRKVLVYVARISSMHLCTAKGFGCKLFTVSPTRPPNIEAHLWIMLRTRQTFYSSIEDGNVWRKQPPTRLWK